jgi:hypothetical protein
MGIPQRLWAAVALYLLFLFGSQPTNTSYWIDQSGTWISTMPGDPAANRVRHQWIGVQPGPEQWGIGSVVGISQGINQTRAFCTKFLDQMNNACGRGGDSGGGVFIRQGHQWQLIGMLKCA